MKQNIKRLIAFLTVCWCVIAVSAYAKSGITGLEVFAMMFWIGIGLIFKNILDSTVNAAFQVFEKGEQ